jgi:hypothetical protein
MRLGHALVLLAACGGRTGLRTTADYKVLFGAGVPGVRAWHSASSAITNVTASWEGEILECTYDGRYFAVGDYAMTTTSDVLDASGALVRHQQGFAQAIRPDGMRTIVMANGCVGTLDADGTYGNEHCAPHEQLVAFAYAPDGKTVLWVHGNAEQTSSTLATGLEDGTNQRVIASLESTGLSDFESAAFSFDGSRVAYVECNVYSSSTVPCRLKTVRLDTLETTTLVDEGAYLSHAAFTPDGTSVVFLDAATSSDEDMSLRIVDVETHVISTLVEHPQANELSGLCTARDD